MTLPRQTLIFLLVSVGLITLPHSQHLPIPVFGLFVILWLWRLLGIWKPAWLPGQWLVFLLTLSAIGLLYSQHHGVFGRDAGTAIFVTALGLKLMEIKSPRDIYLIIYLAMVVAATVFLYQQSIIMGAYTLFVCCVLLATLASINGLSSHTLAALKTAAIIIVQALPIAIVMFVVFPRLEAPRWIWLDDKNTSLSGLNDTLEPGAISKLALSSELAFRVKFKGAIPPPEQRYWRGPVFSYTDGKRWQESKHRHYGRLMDTLKFKGKAYQYTLLMEPQSHPWVYALDMAAEYPRDLKRNTFYQLITDKAPEKRAEYRITSYPEYQTGYITQTEMKDNLQLPASPSDSLISLVKELGGFDLPAETFIGNLFNYFRQQDFYYTLKPPLMTENPIETFLFQTRQGFCSHYATAFVYLLRIANIPARVVGGYQGGVVNTVGDFLEVRQADAHAWAEAWIKDKGWRRFDPTTAIAPERIEQNIQTGQQLTSGLMSFMPFGNSMSWLKQAKQLWYSIDYSWQRWVINYNSASQSSFFESLGIANLKSIIYWLLIILGGFTWLLSRFMFRQNTQPTDPAVKLYRKFCKKLAKTPIRTGEAPYDFAARSKMSYPEKIKEIDTITQLFVTMHYLPNADKKNLLLLKNLVSHFKAP